MSLERTQISNLPRDLIVELLLSLNPKDAMHLLQTNHRYREIDENPIFWRAMLGKHFPDVTIPIGTETDYKKIFKHHSQDKIFTALMNLATTKPVPHINTETKLYFENLVTLFNENINKTNPGPHIHIALEGKHLTNHTMLRNSFHATLTLRLPPSFNLIRDPYNSSTVGNDIYYPNQEIKITNILNCHANGHIVANPFLGKHTFYHDNENTLDKMKNAFYDAVNYDAITNLIKFRKNHDFYLFHSSKGANDTHTILAGLVKYISNMDCDIDFLRHAHKICQYADSKGEKAIRNRLIQFFQLIKISDYCKDDNELEFLKKCQAYHLISTVPMTEFEANRPKFAN